MSSIPCYSDNLPPECGALVVVRCTRVDDHGVWGTVQGWGANCTAYIPIGFVVAQRGRGERRAQADFLTRTKRQATKGKPIVVVARVESIEVTSSKGVDEITFSGSQICENFRLTVTRRGLEKAEEKAALEALKLTQNCAAHLVDKAASKAGVSREWARELCLYKPYRQAVKASSQDVEDESPDPSVAAARLLVNRIGSFEQFSERSVAELLQLPKDAEGSIDFLQTIWKLCRGECLRNLQPTSFSSTVSLGGSKGILKSNSGGNPNREYAAEILRLRTALSTAVSLPPPVGCSTLTVRVEGSSRYSFSTLAPQEMEETAKSFLRDAICKAEEL